MSVVFSPDGKCVVSGSRDGTVSIWDSQTGEKIYEPLEGHINPLQSVAFSPDGKRIISGSNDSMICVWDADTGKEIYGFFDLQQPWNFLNSCAFSPDGKFTASAYNQMIRVWMERRERWFLGHWKDTRLGQLSYFFS